MNKCSWVVTACTVLVWGSAVVRPFAVSATTITVNTTADNTTAGDGKCTLREAIVNVDDAADMTAGDCLSGSGAGDTIVFDVTLPATIRLAYGQLSLTRDVSIVGPGADLLAIDAHHKSRILHLFDIVQFAAAISGLAIRNGQVSEPGFSSSAGGGVLVDRGVTLQMSDCKFVGNGAGGIYGVGGGLEIEGTAALTNCTFTRNRALNKGGGVAVGALSGAGTATLSNCTFNGNRAISANGSDVGGGGMEIEGIASLTNCTFKGNRAGPGTFSGGGAIAVEQNGAATLANCTLNGNLATAGRDGIVGGGGIGLAVSSMGTASATLTGCTLSRNRAVSGFGGDSVGGGIDMESDGTLTLVNCTLSGNEAIGHGPNVWVAGGGIEADGPTPTAITNCTVKGNRSVHGFNTDGGGGIDGGNAATVINTIVADNGRMNCDSAVTSGGHNLSSDANCFASGGTDRINTNPQLTQLGNHGGPTQTMALRPGSPAIDAGDDSVTGPPDNITTDQRGLTRLSGAHVDIGAYEVQ